MGQGPNCCFDNFCLGYVDRALQGRAVAQNITRTVKIISRVDSQCYFPIEIYTLTPTAGIIDMNA